MAQGESPRLIGQPLVFEPGDWRHDVAQCLVELLKRTTLRTLCGEFEKSLRALRRTQGEDRPSSKWELAEALVIQYDGDLLAQPAVRRALAAAARPAGGQRLKPPGRWHPGKEAAIGFTRQLGLPIRLAGEPSPERPPAFVQIAPPPTYRDLADFQLEVSRALLKILNDNSGTARALVTLPTGAGKTRVAVQTLHRWVHEFLESAGNERVSVVWLAHTEELCEQACACIQEVWQSTPDGRESVEILRWWGDYAGMIQAHLGQLRQGGCRVRILVSTPQSYRQKLLEDPDLRADLLAGLRCAVIDEAHRAAAPTYREIIDLHSGEVMAWVGLTATPFAREYDRRDPLAGTFALREIFHGQLVEARRTLGPNARGELQRRGILARPLIRNIDTNTILHSPQQDVGAELTLEQIDAIDRAYAESADRHSRRLVVQQAVADIFAAEPGARVIYFGPTVHDAEQMAFLLRRQQLKSAVVSGTTLRATRRRLINEFRSGELQVLCNCEVLTTGFDAPRITHVVVARPTVSQVLYEQMVGRGLRGAKFGGTKSCVILDCKDRQRGIRPKLGYQGFREIWTPDDWQGDSHIALGIRIHGKGGKTLEANRGADGKARLLVKIPSPSQAGFRLRNIGSGHSQIRLEMAPPGNLERRVLADLALSESNSEYECPVEKFSANTRLEFLVKTSDPSTFVDVSPVAPV